MICKRKLGECSMVGQNHNKYHGEGICVNIYILSFTDKIFYITALWCTYTREMLQVEIKTWLTLCQSDIIPESHWLSQCNRRNFLCITFYTYVISYQSAQFMRRAMHFSISGSWQISFSSAPSIGGTYIVIYRQTVLLYPKSIVRLDLWDVSNQDQNLAEIKETERQTERKRQNIYIYTYLVCYIKKK